jgi:endonuclease/exonuclease/phosphatase family metal-dependent hydrolase
VALTVATYNVRRCVGRDGRNDPERTLAVLRALDADIIALQELEWQPEYALGLLNLFASRLHYRSIPGPTLLRPDGHYGNAILTRFSVNDVQHVDLSVPRREPRGMVSATLSNAQGRWCVFATHLGLRPWERRRQMRQLLAALPPNADEPTILMGDLNEWFLWGRPLRWLRTHFGHMPARRTYPAVFPLFALDRIWVKPRAQLLSLETYVSDVARIASDHLPLRATIATQ